MTQYLTPVTQQRRSIAYVLEALEAKGLIISPSTLRRYTELVGGKSRSEGPPYYRTYTPEDLQRIEAMVYLRGLGYSEPEAAEWIRTPNRAGLRARIEGVQRLIRLAEDALLPQPT